MEKLIFVFFVLVLSPGLATWLSAQVVTLTNGSCQLTVDSFGQSNHYNVGPPCGNFMSDTPGLGTINFISINNGPVRVVSAQNFAIVNPITPSSPSTAESTVQMGDITIDFAHTLGEPPSCQWDSVATISSDNPADTACYYAHTDYDIVVFNRNSGEWDPAATRFTVRHCDGPCTASFRSDAPDHFQQSPTPFLRNAIMGFQSCVNLNDTPATLACPLDWEGAMQFGDTDAPLSLAKPVDIGYMRERKGP